MSAEQAPKRRNASIIENSQYAPARPPVDDRRRQLESLGQDRAAIERAKQEIAAISRQQGGRTSPSVQLDDLEVQKRKPRQIIVGPAPLPAPTSEADALPQPAADDTAMPDRQPLTIEDLPVQRPAPAAPKQAHMSAPSPASRTTFERIEHPPTRSAAPTRPLPTAQTAAYARDQRYAPASAHSPIYDPYAHWEAPIALARSQPLVLLLLAALVCVPVIWLLSKSPATIISGYGGEGWRSTLGNVAQAFGGDVPAHVFGTVDVPAGEHSVVGQPSIDAAAIDTILSKYGSPAAGTGHVWVKLGQEYGIDPAYAVAFFIHESSAGSNPGWAGNKPDGSTTHNVGNIICAGYATCYNRFRDYASWDEGIADWYKLISNEYVSGRGAASVEQIIPIYAPSSDNNDVPGYVNVVVSMVEGWRQGVLR